MRIPVSAPKQSRESPREGICRHCTWGTAVIAGDDMLLWLIIHSPEYINGKSELIGKPFAMTFVPAVRRDLPLHRPLADTQGRTEYESVHI